MISKGEKYVKNPKAVKGIPLSEKKVRRNERKAVIKSNKKSIKEKLRADLENVMQEE